MKVLVRIWLGVLLGTFLLVGCSGRRTEVLPQTSETTEKLKVVTTLFPYYDFTRQIAGDEIELTMVIPAGMDSHSFEPTPADMLMIQNADVLICNGGEMEQWLEQVLEAVDTSNITVISLMDYVDTLQEEHVEGMEDAAHHHYSEDGHEHGDEDHMTSDSEEAHNHQHHHEDDDGFEIEIEYDEHIWTSPVNARKIVGVISDTLQNVDPVHQEIYQTNALRYQNQLEELHQEFLQVANDKKRNMIIVGDKFPFRYLADEYGFSYRAAFSGCSSDTEPSARTIAYLIDKVKEEQMPVIYYLELSSHRVSEIIGEETGATPMLLHSCHNVSRAQFDDGITYMELMKQNVENLRKGLDE